MGASEGIVWYLRASEQRLGAVRLVVLEGRVSNGTAAELGRILACQHADGIRAVVVDLAEVDYINGVGLRIFEHAAADLVPQHVELLLCDLRPPVRAAFNLAGDIPGLTIEASRDAALRRYGAIPSG